jgi:hypothetical protein
MERGLGATGGLEGVDIGPVRVAAVSWESGLGLLTELDSWRGLGGGGGREDDGEDAVVEVESFELVRKATGFCGGGGLDLVLEVETVDIRFACVSPSVSVSTRRMVGLFTGSSSEDRSIRFGVSTPGLELLEDGLRSGSFGRTSGWSLSIWGNIDFERCCLSSSISRKEAAIAALSSGSCSSDGLDL